MRPRVLGGRRAHGVLVHVQRGVVQHALEGVLRLPTEHHGLRPGALHRGRRHGERPHNNQQVGRGHGKELFYCIITTNIMSCTCRQMPGPAVVVCQGDTVVAEIINKLHTETTSVHWHGKQ